MSTMCCVCGAPARWGRNMKKGKYCLLHVIQAADEGEQFFRLKKTTLSGECSVSDGKAYREKRD